MHWYSGLTGSAFQSYTLGSILGARPFDATVSAHPHIPEEIARGEFGALRGWLTEHLYQHGHKFTPHELVRRATGTPMRIEPHIGYLRRKFGELYSL